MLYLVSCFAKTIVQKLQLTLYIQYSFHSNLNKKKKKITPHESQYYTECYFNLVKKMKYFSIGKIPIYHFETIANLYIFIYR